MVRKKEGIIVKEGIRIKREWKNLVFNGLFAITTLLIILFFYSKIFIATTILSIVTIIGMVKWKSWSTFAIFLFGAIGGTGAEMLAINSGVWSYAIINLFNIPIWLFIVWGNAACFIYQTAIELVKLGVKR